jgi:ketosteroid isomerase-like protein
LAVVPAGERRTLTQTQEGKGTSSQSQYDLVAGGITDQGSHFTLWRKQADGTWEIYRDMWHSDRPL